MFLLLGKGFLPLAHVTLGLFPQHLGLPLGVVFTLIGLLGQKFWRSQEWSTFELAAPKSKAPKMSVV